MPEKDGAEEKSTKSVVNKKQKQMMGEEGYDIARDMGRVRPSKDKKDATTMPPSKEMKKTQKVNKGPSALDIVKKKYEGQIMNVGKKKVKEELDLTQVAESFGGYITEVEVKGQGPIKKIVKKLKKQGKIDPEADTAVGNELSPNTKAGIEAQARRENLGGYDDAKPTSVRRGTSGKSLEDIKKGLEQDRADYRDMRKLKAQERRTEKLKDPKFRASETLRKAKQTDVKGGSSVKRGDPVPQEEIPTKKKPVPEIGGFQRNTFKPEIMARRKTFKQSFGKPTGADPVTGKPTYMRPGVLDKSGKPRRAERQKQTTKKTVSQVKGDIEFKDLLKKGGATGDFSDTMTADQRAKGQAKRDKRMTELGTGDPWTTDTRQAARKIAKTFGTEPVKGGLPMGEPTVPKEVDRKTKPELEKIGSQLKKTKIGFKDFDRKMRDAKVDADIERTISGSGGGGRKTKIGTGTASDPEVVKNGRAKNAIDVTNYKEPSALAKSAAATKKFLTKNPVGQLMAYDMGKGILGKIKKLRLPKLVGGMVGRRSAQGGGAA